jgi:hypothetical protein
MAGKQTPDGATADPQSTDLAVRRSSDLTALTDLGRILVTGEFDTEIVDDPDAISRQIIEELLAAETDDELERGVGATGWIDYEGIPVEIHSFRWRKSDYEQGAPIYLIVFATDLRDGEPVTLTTGSKNVIAQLINLAQRDRFPVVRMLTRADKPTANGYYPLWLSSTPEELARRKEEGIAAREGADS